MASRAVLLCLALGSLAYIAVVDDAKPSNLSCTYHPSPGTSLPACPCHPRDHKCQNGIRLDEALVEEVQWQAEHHALSPSRGRLQASLSAKDDGTGRVDRPERRKSRSHRRTPSPAPPPPNLPPSPSQSPPPSPGPRPPPLPPPAAVFASEGRGVLHSRTRRRRAASRFHPQALHWFKDMVPPSDTTAAHGPHGAPAENAR